MIPGSPAGLQAAAGAIQSAVSAAQAAPRSVDAARSTALGGWSGSAADAFGESASRTRTRLDSFITTAGTAAAPLRTYAGQLQAAQIQFAAAITPAERATAVAQALAANQAAAAAISAIDTEQEQAADWKAGIKGTSIATGLTLGGARAYERYLGATATKGIPGFVVPPDGPPRPATLTVADEAARNRFNTIGQRFRYGSWALAPVFAGAGQVAADSANPSLSTAQRVGRTTAQAVTVGGASIAGSVALGAAIGSVVPGPGTAVGALAGLAAGTIGSLVAGGVMDRYNDGIVNWAGDAAESVSQWAGGAADKTGQFLDDITPW